MTRVPLRAAGGGQGRLLHTPSRPSRPSVTLELFIEGKGGIENEIQVHDKGTRDD